MTWKLFEIIISCKKRFNKESGANLVEYSLLVALIAVAALVALTDFGQVVMNKFTQIVADIF